MGIQKSNKAVDTHILSLQVAGYANNTFIGLVFFSKVFCFIDNIFLQYKKICFGFLFLF